MFSPQLLDHFQNPRNVGDLEPADARSEVTNPVCGDILRLSLRIEDGRIAEARFKAQGCVPTIACGSALTELMRGKTVKEARSLNSLEIVAVLGSVPQASMHAAALALEALSNALNGLPT
jgi:nitrogen fixation protein NifU and related proteins